MNYGYDYFEEKEPNLKDLLAIRISNWKKLGQRLGFPAEELSEIEKYAENYSAGSHNSHNYHKAIKQKLFGGWKKKYSLRPTNRAVVQALIDAGEQAAAAAFCSTHGINFKRCDSAERERLKEPKHKVGVMNMIFHQEAQQEAFTAYLNRQDAEQRLEILIRRTPNLLNCDWRNVLDEMRFNLKDYNFYTQVNLPINHVLYEIAPIFFHGKCMKPRSTLNVQQIIRKINLEISRKALPRSWCLVVFLLHSRGGIISLQQYESLAHDCHVPDDEVYNLLDYVHINLGLILHYKDIPELKDLVICSSSLVIRECLTLFDVILQNSPSVERDGLVAKEIIHTQGNQELLSIILTLLKHYRFMTEMVVANRAYFFIPLLLHEKLLPQRRVDNSTQQVPSPFFICFSSDEVPCGVFYSLYGCLVAEKFQFSENYGRKLMSFIVSSINVVLISHKKSIELKIRADLDRVPSETYDVILNNLIPALETVSGLYDGVSFDFQFPCPGSRFPYRVHKSKPIEKFKLQCCGQPNCRVAIYNYQVQHKVWRGIWIYMKLDVPEIMDTDNLLTSAEDIEIMSLLEHHLKEEGGVPFRVAKVVLYGPPGCGKTTVCRRLTGQLSNINSDPEHAPTSSTGIEDPVTLNLYRTVDQTTVLVKGSQQNEWAPQTIQQQVEMLFCYLQQTAQSIEPMGTTSSLMTASTSLQHSIRHSAMPQSSHFNALNSVSSQPDLTDDQKPILQKDSIIFNTLKEMVQNKEWHKLITLFAHIEDGTLLSIIDTGGQPEFHDILPYLIRGPSLFLVFLKLVDALDEKFDVSYRIEGNESEPYKSSYTPINIIHQVLSLCHSLGEEYSALLIGSYKDKVTSDQIKEMDKSLQSSLKNAAFFYQDHLKRYDSKHYIHPVDNMNGDALEIQQLQGKILKTVRKFQPKVLPTSWFLFHLMLKYLYEEAKTCTLQQANELALELNITEEDVPHILEFIDHNFGTILYYKSIPSLVDTVICDPSVVFEPIAKLVGESFGANPDRPTISEAIRRSGLIPLNHVESICRESVNRYIPLESIIEILKEANVVTEIKGKNEKISLFMPCLLSPDPSIEASSSYSHNDHSRPAPLIFTFTSSSHPASGLVDVPVGLFNALIIKLSQSSLDWVLEDSRQIFKNRMYFFFCQSNLSVVELISHVSFIQVNVIENPTPQKCLQVREEISSEIKEIMSSNSFMKNMEMKVGFFCPGSTSLHPAVFLGEATAESPKSVVCGPRSCVPLVHPLRKHHKIWFKEQVEHMDTSHVSAAAYPNNSVMVPTHSSNNLQDSLKNDVQTSFPVLSSDDLLEVLCNINAVPIEKWKVLGLVLRLELDKINQIQAESGTDYTSFKVNFIQAWLNTGKATWNGLAAALEHKLVGLNAIANTITTKYIRSSESSMIMDVD